MMLALPLTSGQRAGGHHLRDRAEGSKAEGMDQFSRVSPRASRGLQPASKDREDEALSEGQTR
jgi:hypothetical protein